MNTLSLFGTLMPPSPLARWGRGYPITLEEIREHFKKDCSLTAIHIILVKMGYTVKKTLKASEQDREDVKKAREEWRKFSEIHDRKKLVFIDETGAKTNMTRLYGRAKKGQRCYDTSPDGRWERVSILSAIWDNGETQSLVFEGALDSKMYEAYVEKILVPALRAGDVVIADNLNVHKSAKARKLIEDKGCESVYLPPYSPDLNPIEKMWSKVKQFLRCAKARISEELDNAIAGALASVTEKDAQNWFASCGYL